ncbi:hypothetical protein LRS58_20595 [Rhodococcus sp. BH2-1]|nr:hypothetical protein [Rhodococcus sp. BH2-1]
MSSDRLYVNETYTVTVHCTERSTVGVTVDVDTFEATQDQLLGGQPVPPNDDMLATVEWTPTSTGAHTLYAYGCALGPWPENRPPTVNLPVEVFEAPPSTGSAGSIDLPAIIESLLGA